MISTNWGSATDIGLVRQYNEDSFLAQFPVFLVADGMGGRAAGEVASNLTSVRFRELAASGNVTAEQVNRALIEVNEQILVQSNEADEFEGMGTTAVGLVHINDGPQELWLIFNVGDSRIYRWYAASLDQVTIDHTEVQEMIDLGQLASEDAHVHPLRHVITKAVGTDDTVEPDIWLFPPVAGERFLLCSDGLTSELSDREIAAVLNRESDPILAATRLVEKAVAAGGHDNITVVVIDVFDEDSEELSITSPGRADSGFSPPAFVRGDPVSPAERGSLLEVPQPEVARSSGPLVQDSTEADRIDTIPPMPSGRSDEDLWENVQMSEVGVTASPSPIHDPPSKRSFDEPSSSPDGARKGAQ